MNHRTSPAKAYDFLLKFLLVGDSDVGKGEILASLEDGASESPYGYNMGIDYKTTTILLDGRRVKLQLWDTSGQGRFCTIFRSYSRGAQVCVCVCARAIVFECAPLPKKSVFSIFHKYFLSPLLSLSSPSLSFLVLSLQDLCCRSIVSCTPVHLVDKLPLPLALKSHLKSFSMANGLNARMMHGSSYSVTTTNTTHIATKRTGGQLLKKKKCIRPQQLSPATAQSCTGNSCKIS
ncbi:ras-related protein Rab-40B [Oncorhynchus kisutch]|uniref:ras-related protein Rab-40B n=1 Tax=Oncorhynchus kisutch TaxID=8019 RepID=UPI0012DD0A5C|nr:ras-related protein Rab-40B [Oncorhynchus kisutch]